MKCEKCNEREANFFYSSNINGEVTEKHLCHECAEAEGLMNHEDMFSGLFRMRSPFGLLDSMWSDDFFGRLSTMSRPAIGQSQTKNIPDRANDDLMAKREIAQLKAQLQNAVAAEDFEKAIELRDEIRSRENRT